MLEGAVPLVTVTRHDQRTGVERVESAHPGHLVVVDGTGGVAAAHGAADTVVFVRSAAKPFQAAACLELLESAPAADELAVAWSSHRAEPGQLDAVARLLARAGTDPASLTCPPARPEDDPGRGLARIHHNCSGKHALFALAGPLVGCPRERLLDPAGPLQDHVLARLADVLGPPEAIGVDGCGAPAVAVPLVALARAYARLLASDRFAAVRDAGLAHPVMVGGAGRLESALLGAGVVAKIGAEGVFAAAWRREGRALALAAKAADGADRAVTAATAAVLTAAGAVPPDCWRPPPPLGGGDPAGAVRAVPALDELGAGL